MDINKIYTNIFPIGGIDDNNKYAELTGDKINTVQLLEPALGVKEFIVSKKDMYDKNNIPYKYAYRIPLISINNYRINQVDLCEFRLDYTGFLPGIMFEFFDSSNSLLSTNVPKDGSIISIYIGGNGDELYYKPIRQDFILTSIRKLGEFKYRVYGKLNIPYGYRKESWCGGKCTAMQALFNVAVWTGLGFATNFTKPNTLDSMCWRNNETGTYFDFIEDITAHACYSPNTFFTSFIDQYNVLNFVECHSLLSHGGQKTDVPAMIYRNVPPYNLPEFNPEKNEKTTRNQIPIQDYENEVNNHYQRLSYYYLSNHICFKSWTNYIEDFHEINNSNSSLSDGFKTYITYNDSNVGNWGGSEYKFTIRPIDNLKRDPSTQKIQSLEDDPKQDSYIPLNLMQMNNEEYLEELSSIDDMTNIESFLNFGNIDTSNTFKQYYFAEVQNKYQLKCMKKCGLKVRLQNYNPAITKFSRIWVDIYDYKISNNQIAHSDVKEDDKSQYAAYQRKKNENILVFDGEGKIEVVEGNSNGVNLIWPMEEYNRALSGWYVVTELEIIYDSQDNNLKMDLVLNRIEYRPCFKSEYSLAKKAVDKYKEENLIEDILNIQ